VWQALVKAADGIESKWLQVAHSVFWAEWVTVRKWMGCSPYFAAMGTHPLIPLDITEATYLQPPPDSVLSTTDLLTQWVIVLQCQEKDLAKLHTTVFTAWKQAAILFEKKHLCTIQNFNFQPSSLVLMWNTRIEYKLNQKMKPQYLRPLIVVSWNRGGAYIVAELNGSVFDHLVAAFRLIPYFPRTAIPILTRILDTNSQCIHKLEDSDFADNPEVITEESHSDI
jgi:hypothetical protein